MTTLVFKTGSVYNKYEPAVSGPWQEIEWNLKHDFFYKPEGYDRSVTYRLRDSSCYDNIYPNKCMQDELYDHGAI